MNRARGSPSPGDSPRVAVRVRFSKSPNTGMSNKEQFMFSTRLQNRRLKSRRGPALEPLESRELLSVSSLSLSGPTLYVKTDNAATSVDVSRVGSNIQILE